MTRRTRMCRESATPPPDAVPGASDCPNFCSTSPPCARSTVNAAAHGATPSVVLVRIASDVATPDSGRQYRKSVTVYRGANRTLHAQRLNALVTALLCALGVTTTQHCVTEKAAA